MMIKSSTDTNAVTVVAIFVVLVLIGIPCSKAQSPIGAPTMSPRSPTMSAPAPAPAIDCLTVLANVSDCLSFVQDGSNLTVPDKACCPELAGLLDSNPICLCQLVGNSESYGVNISRALMLPDACKLEIPPLDSCPAAPVSPVSVSVPSPSSMSESPTSTAGPTSDSGEAASPGSGNGGISGASSTAIHDLSTIICLGVAIFIAYYF